MVRLNGSVARVAPGRPDCATTAALLADRIEDLARELVGAEPTSRDRTEIRFRNRGSLAVVVAGEERGSFYDHEAGHGGDALGLVAHLRGVRMGDAWEWALAWLGSAPAVTPATGKQASRAAPNRVDSARRIWTAAVDAKGTIVESYLTRRGLSLPGDAPIRFHPSCPRDKERQPAMVALMTDAETGEPCGVHRTFLQPDGSGKAAGQAKMMLGGAGIIRLADAEGSSTLGIAEGIETALAVMQRGRWAPVWAAASAGALADFPLLARVEGLVIFADADVPGLKAARACAGRWAAHGRHVRLLAPAAGDWDAGR